MRLFGITAQTAMRYVSAACPGVRVIMLSGHVRADYIDRALKAGAWGYLSKNEDVSLIIAAVKKVHAGQFAFGPESEAELYRKPRPVPGSEGPVRGPITGFHDPGERLAEPGRGVL